MAVTLNNGTQTPVVGTETTIATIAGGPFDFISVYIQGGAGGAGGAIGVNLYATVAGIPTLVGAAQVMGSAAATGSLVEFADLKTGATGTTSVSQQAGSSYLLNAGGSNYTVKIIDLSTVPIPPGGVARQPCVVTIAGVNASDTAPSTANQTFFNPLTPGATGSLATFPGFQEQMDVGITQVAGMNVTVTITASNGAGSVTATVKSQLFSTPTTIPGGSGSVFRNVQLPVATTYTVSITNNANANVSTVLSAITYEGAGAGGGGGGAVVLTGNTNGPSNNNRLEAFNIESADADVLAAQFTAINATGGEFYVGMSGLTADRTVNVPVLDSGSKVIIKDEDGSLALHNIIVAPAGGKTIDGGATYTMTAVQDGVKGSITILMNSNAPPEWSIV